MVKNHYLLNFYLLFLFIASIQISINKKQSLVLPYKIYHPPLDGLSTKEEIFLSLHRNYFYTLFEIGNPPQKIPMFYNFNDSFLSFHSDSKFLSKFESSYNPSKSQSFKNLQNNTIQEDLLFNINNEKYFKNFTFMNLNNNKINENYYSDVGLQNFYKENLKKDVKYPNFLYQLKQLGLIDYISFSINQTSENEGFININLEPNEYAPTLYSNDKKYTAPIRTLESETINDMSGEFLWSLEISLVYYKNAQRKTITINIDHYELNEDQYSVLLNPAYGYIRGPFDYRNLIKKDFFDEFMKNNICSQSKVNRKHFYSCDANYRDQLKEKFPPLYFYYPVTNYSYTYTFVLDFEDLFYENNGILYFLVVYDNTGFGSDKFAHISEWILGKPFFDKYQLSFDVEKRRISFYENKNGYEKKIIKKSSVKNKNMTSNNKNNNVNLNGKNNLYLSELISIKNMAFISLSLFIIFLSFFCLYKLRL